MNRVKNITLPLFTVVISLFLLVGAVINFSLCASPIQRLFGGETDLKGFVEEVKEAYVSNLEGKEHFINLNGLFARLTGRHVYNGVSVLENGMLDYESLKAQDMTDFANGLTEFDAYLSAQEIPFLYVQAPNKSDLEDRLVRPGVENCGNDNANALLGLLKEAGVSYLDLRPTIVPTVEAVEQNFYRTDHHWNSYGAFLAYGEILAELDARFSEEGLDLSHAELSSWESTVYKDWFLGSRGKRVGIYFGGVDDLTVLTPKFETQMSMYVPKHRAYTSGDFAEAVMNTAYLDAPDYFSENPYCVYIGGDYPLVHHVNNLVENDLKVLLIKDSFTLPVQAFLSASIKELDVLDPRYYTDTTVAEYVALSQPDIVIMMINPSIFGTKSYYELGVTEAMEWSETDEREIVKHEEAIPLAVREDTASNHTVLTSDLIPHTPYTLRFDGVSVTAGEVKEVTVALYSPVSQTLLRSYVFDLERIGENGGAEWSLLMPETKEGEVQLVLYCGRPGATKGNGVIYQNVTLEKWNNEK